VKSTTGGSGSGLTVNIVSVDGVGHITAYSISSGGTGYVLNDRVTVATGGANALLFVIQASSGVVTTLRDSPGGGWKQTIGNDRLSGSFVDLWKPGLREWVPSLFLNGTSVEKGHRIITTNLRLTNVFLDAEDAADTLASGKLGATHATCNIPLSTAADMSARFTYVSPAGRFPGGSHVVDGGYFENSGATTALEIVRRIDDWCEHEGISNVDVKVIMISNDPRKRSLSIAPAKPGPESNAPGRTKPVTDHSAVLGDVMAPIYALLNTRDARGVYAQKAIRREQRPFKADEPEHLPSDTKDIVYFGLLDMKVPLPLGWMLSRAAAETMSSQLDMNEGVIKNGEAMDEVLKALPPSSK
jgi:hypothetical protein